MNTSPTDRMFDRMDQSAFACVPRDLVEAYTDAKRSGDWSAIQAAVTQ